MLKPTVRRADHAEQVARDRLTHAAWGALLSVDEYVAREERLRRSAFAAGLRAWLLVDPAHGKVVLASCETYDMRSYVDGAEGRTLGIASVYVEPSLRGRGYATELLTGLHETLDQERPQAWILFSEVGPGIYARVGYQARTVDGFVAPARAGEPDVEFFADERAAAVLHSVWLPSGFIVWPTAAQLDWHRERERIYAAALGHPPLPEAGARCAAGAVFWAADWKSRTLHVTLLSAPDPQLIAAAQSIAHRYGLWRVVSWQGGGLVGEPYDAQGSLPMLRPVDARVRSAHWTTIPRAVWV